MITLFRALRYWQLKTKWKLAVMQFIDQKAKEVIKDPEIVEKKIIDLLTDKVQTTNPETSEL